MGKPSKMVRQKSKSLDNGALSNEFQINLKYRLLSWKNYQIIDEPILDNIPNDIFNVNNDQITFPMGISSSIRRYIHLIATELELFHCSVGQNETRQIIVSRKLPIITPTEQIPSTSPISFKSNIIHQYFELTDADKSYRQSLLGIGSNRQQMSELQQHLARERSPNIDKILHSQSNYIYQYSDLSEAVGADFNPYTSNATFLHVTTVRELEEICTILSNPLNHEIAFDLEMNNNFVFHGCTCLIQISCKTTERFICGHDLSLENQYGEDDSDLDSVQTMTHDWYELDVFIDPMYLPWKDIARTLFPIFSDPSIIKVCHGARNGDVKALYRDFGIIIVNGFDTQEACKYLGHDKLGLADVLMKLRAPGSGWELDGSCREISRINSADQVEEDYNTIKKRLSQADWTQRPLPADMIRYGRMDVRFLIPLYHILVRKLCETSGGLSMNESMEIDVREIQIADTHHNSSTNSLASDLDISNTRDHSHVLSQFSFSFSDQDSPTSVQLDSIDQIFSLTLSNSSELWSPTIPDLHDKTSRIKVSLLKNKYESFRRKSKSKHWDDLKTHVFMRLVQWRERVGYIVNESPAYVCPTSLLLMIATKLPKNADEMHIMYNPLPQYVQPDLISDNGIENILTVIQNSLQEYQESTMKSITIVNETITIENSPLSTLNEVEKNKEDHELNNLIQSEVSIPTPSPQSQEPDTPTPALKPDTPIPSLQVPDTPNPISQVPDTPTASSSSKEIVPEKSQVLTSFPHLTVLKVFGVVLTFRIFGYFLGIPPLPIVRNIFPSFFSWTLRLRANMKRL